MPSDPTDDASAPSAKRPLDIDSRLLIDAVVALALARGEATDSLFGPPGSIPGDAPAPPALRVLGVLMGREPASWSADDWRLAATALAHQVGMLAAPAPRRRRGRPMKPDPRAMGLFGRLRRPAGRPRLLTDDDAEAIVAAVDALRLSGNYPNTDVGVLRKLLHRLWVEEGCPGHERAYVDEGVKRWAPYLSKARRRLRNPG